MVLPYPNAYKIHYTKDNILKQLRPAIRKMNRSAYFKSSVNSIKRAMSTKLGRKLKDTKRIICWGLGSFSEIWDCEDDNTNSIQQFAFIVCLRAILKAPLEFYDPVFTATDKLIISKIFRFDIARPNDYGKVKVTEPSLYFLPHCDYEMSNNLIKTNWSPKSLQNIILVGNGNKGVVQTQFQTKAKFSRFKYLVKVKPIVNQVNLNRFDDETDRAMMYHWAFSSLAVHVFPASAWATRKTTDDYDTTPAAAVPQTRQNVHEEGEDDDDDGDDVQLIDQTSPGPSPWPISQISTQRKSRRSLGPSPRQMPSRPLSHMTSIIPVQQRHAAGGRASSELSFQDLQRIFGHASQQRVEKLIVSTKFVYSTQNIWPMVQAEIFKVFNANKETANEVELKFPLGFLPGIQWPSMENVTTLTAHVHAISEPYKRDDCLVLPRGFNWSSTFPSLTNVNLHGDGSSSKLSSAFIIFSRSGEVAPSVQRLELQSGTDLLLLGNMSIVFLNVQSLLVKGIEDLSTVAKEIWKFKFVKELELEIFVGNRNPKNTYPHLDAAFTGMTEETCVLLNELVDKRVSYGRNLQVKRSIRDLKGLKECKISFCDRGLYLKHSYNLITNVTGQYGFQDPTRMELGLRVKIFVSSFCGYNTRQMTESLESLTPFCDIFED